MVVDYDAETGRVKFADDNTWTEPTGLVVAAWRPLARGKPYPGPGPRVSRRPRDGQHGHPLPDPDRSAACRSRDGSAAQVRRGSLLVLHTRG
ncbi:hypothetical protein A1O7_02252 [Cladophialophora yegresii CBS 114405]|uniref:Uncharacterized protein n=1 Tax=Cladophialophora yegresii CBS 114405 TaxID=1182544 RepID=W9W166_9EURO|nr:uncharacterized protein A1O7_02252 [Cladophialophora yegresii CBS 114405]EXJ61822.1 hypothetical protein A1O7_02252 [Cladophialophora yegresii CBS 114405]